MARRSRPCTQAVLNRLLKAAKEVVGVERIAGLKMTDDGPVVLIGKPAPDADAGVNEWDEVLNNDAPAAS